MIRVVLVVQPAIGGLRPAGGGHYTGRERADIARNSLSVRRRHQIEVGAGPQGSILDRADKAAQSAPSEDIVDLAGFSVDRRGDLFRDQPARIPSEVAQQRGSKQRKQKQVGERQPERGSSDQLTECRHESYIPRRGWYGAAAARNPCRSSSVAWKCAHR